MDVEPTVNTSNARVVVVGQTPPPYHGQSMMIDLLLRHPMRDVQLFHVRMAFSDRMDQVGRFQFSKLIHLVVVVWQILWTRFRYSADILYYPPAGPNKVPVFRDLILLGCTRWFFRKTIYHFHANGISSLLSTAPGPLQWIAKWILGKPDISVQLTQELSADAIYLNSKQTVVVPNAVVDPFANINSSVDQSTASHVRHEHGLKNPAVDGQKPLVHHSANAKLIYLGTVCEGKGIIVLLEACKVLRDRTIPFQLDIVGSFQSEEFEKEVRGLIDRHGLQSVVNTIGQRTGDEKWNRLQSSDIFCFPTHYDTEGFPCVLLEAMCASLPIVATRWRGIPSIVEEGCTGFLVEPHHPESLADQIEKLIANPDLRKAFGEAGRVRYDQLFTVQKHMDKMRGVFLDALG